MTSENNQLILQKLQELNPLLEDHECNPNADCDSCIFAVKWADSNCLLDMIIDLNCAKQ